MSIQIEQALDSLKRDSLNVILGSVYIKSPAMKDFLASYVGNGKSVFESLISMLDFSGAAFASDYVNSAFLLTYMDFYTIYSLTYANYAVFESLKNMSSSKYNYIYNLYRDAYAIIREKSFSSNYKYIRYCNFGLPKEINVSKSRTNIRGNAVSDMLGLSGVLTLPILKTREIKPSSISFNYSDASSHTIEQSLGDNSINFSILRSHSSKLGMLDLASQDFIIHRYEGDTPNVVGYSGVPELTGTVYGHFSKEIHVIVDKLIYDPTMNVVATIYLKGSSNGYDWSTPFKTTPGQEVPIMIERDVLIGLNIKLHGNFGIEEKDRWVIRIKDVEVASPEFELKLGFGALDMISHIKYSEVSPYRLDLVPGSAKLEKLKYDASKTSPFVYDNRICHYFVTSGPVSFASIVLKQNDYDLASRNGSLFHKYTFMINDITGFVTEYKQHGGLSLNAIDVKEIGSFTISASSHIQKEEFVHSITDPRPAKSFIEYNVYAQNEIGRVIIPVIEKDIIQNLSSKATFNLFKVTDIDPVNADVVGAPLGTILYSTKTKRYWRYLYNEDEKRNVIQYYGTFKSEFNAGDIIKFTDNKQTYIMNESGELKLYVNNINDFIPMIFEYVFPDKIETYDADGTTGLATYSQRFPVDSNYHLDGDYGYMLAYGLTTREKTTSTYDVASNKTMLHNYVLNTGYCLWYPFKINSMIETVRNDLSSVAWLHAGGNIYYMYYMDELNEVHVAIRQSEKGTNVLRPFTGTLEPAIELRSLDKPHVTPLVFDFALLCV